MDSKKKALTQQPKKAKPSQILAQKRKKGGSKSKSTKVQKVPLAQGRRVRTVQPRITTLPNGGTRIEKREFVQDVILPEGSLSLGDTDWIEAGLLVLNAALGTTFPWLAGAAALYESYKFIELAFDYETSSPATVGGSVALVPCYDPDEELPDNKRQALEFQDTVRTPLWEDAHCRCSSNGINKRKSYFNRPANVDLGDGLDFGLYDVGNLGIFVSPGDNTAEGETLGELWVDYAVELYTPKLDTQLLHQFWGGYTFSADGSVHFTNEMAGMEDYPLGHYWTPVYEAGNVRAYTGLFGYRDPADNQLHPKNAAVYLENKGSGDETSIVFDVPGDYLLAIQYDLTAVTLADMDYDYSLLPSGGITIENFDIPYFLNEAWVTTTLCGSLMTVNSIVSVQTRGAHLRFYTDTSSAFVANAGNTVNCRVRVTPWGESSELRRAVNLTLPGGILKGRTLKMLAQLCIDDVRVRTLVGREFPNVLTACHALLNSPQLCSRKLVRPTLGDTTTVKQGEDLVISTKEERIIRHGRTVR